MIQGFPRTLQSISPKVFSVDVHGYVSRTAHRGLTCHYNMQVCLSESREDREGERGGKNPIEIRRARERESEPEREPESELEREKRERERERERESW